MRLQIKSFIVPSLLSGMLMYCPLAARASIIGYWQMSEGSGTTVQDSSINGNTGTLTAGGGHSPVWTTGPFGPTDSAVAMQGYSDRIVVPLTNSLGLTSDFTVSMWADATFLDSYPYLIEMSNDSQGSSREWFIQGDNSGSDQMYVWSDVNGNWQHGLGFKVGGGGTALNTWHNYTFSYTQSTGTFQSYVDGTLESTIHINGDPSMPGFTDIEIGGSGKSAFDSWEGGVSDVLILNNAVSSSDVTAIMNQSYAGMDSAAPEPSSSLLVAGAIGLLTMALHRRRRLVPLAAKR